jgi:hypothetical protein
MLNYSIVIDKSKTTTLVQYLIAFGLPDISQSDCASPQRIKGT